MSAFPIRFRPARAALAASLLWTLVPEGPANAATTVYTTRPTFLAALTTSDTDDFSAAGYAQGDQDDEPDYDRHSNAHMNAVRGETVFTPTGFPNFNFIITQSGNPWYCAGCNGSFRMTFTNTSQGGTNGVFGAGFDSRYTATTYIAFVTFGDGSTQETPLNGRAFFGITSDKLIRSIHVGLTGGATTQSGNFEMDNLTIGNICGDGSPGGAEGCDDGNANDSDCCHNNCTAWPNGTVCGDQTVSICSGADSCNSGLCSANDVPAGTAMAGCDDSNACTTDQCNGSGACQNPIRANGTSCSDGNVCNGNEYCSSGNCTNGSPPNCNDYNFCTQDSCDPLTGCEYYEGPAETCVEGLKGKLQVKYDAETGEKSQLKWKLAGGDAFDQASLGDPTASASFEICIYDESGGVASVSSRMNIGPTVRFQSNDPDGVSFSDSLGFWDGIKTLKLKTAAVDGKSSVTLAAKGTRIPLASPVSAEQVFTQDTRVAIQMHNTQTSRCWSSEFTEATKHTGTLFKATAP
jgi:hypothetical protein